MEKSTWSTRYQIDQNQFEENSQVRQTRITGEQTDRNNKLQKNERIDASQG